MKKIFLRFLNAMLAFLLFFQVISAFYGGILLVISPGGEKLQMPLTFLEGSPFRNYLLPGLILLVLLGVFPALAFAGLVFRPRWEWAGSLNIYRDRHWGWTYTLYTGLMLIIWIDVEILVVKSWSFLQTLYGSLGLALVILCLVPGLMDRYRTNES